MRAHRRLIARAGRNYSRDRRSRRTPLRAPPPRARRTLIAVPPALRPATALLLLAACAPGPVPLGPVFVPGHHGAVEPTAGPAEASLTDDDRCPDAPETRNGYQDDDGCPDELPARLVDALATCPLGHAELDAARHGRLPEHAHAALRRLAAAMREFPDIRVEVGSHCGDGPVHARRCATAAIDALVRDGGVARDRLRARVHDDPGDGPRLEFRLIVD